MMPLVLLEGHRHIFFSLPIYKTFYYCGFRLSYELFDGIIIIQLLAMST